MNVISIKTGETVVSSKPYVRQAYTETNGAKCTEKYTHIQTDRVYAAIEALGFVQASKSAAPRATEHSRHITTFESPNLFLDGCKPRVIVDNSHDGSRAMYIRFGIYRMVCANGLIVGNDIVQPIRILHRGKVDNIERQVYDFVARATEVATSMYDKMKNTQLTCESIRSLTHLAFELRYGKDKMAPNSLYIRMAATNMHWVRYEDMGNNLWVIYNRLQEYMMQGVGRRSRAITSERRSVDFNNELSNLALKFAA